MKQKDTFGALLLSKGAPTKYWMLEIQKSNHRLGSLSQELVKQIRRTCLPGQAKARAYNGLRDGEDHGRQADY